jgi:hypothetical protein
VKRRYYLKPARNVNSFVILIFLLLAAGCGKPHISEDVLVKVYVENLIALETYSFNADSLISHQNKMFNKYNISRNDFEQQMKNYSEDSKEWQDFFKQANKYLAELKGKDIIN